MKSYKNSKKVIFLAPHLKLSGGVSILVQYAEELTVLGYEVYVVVVNKNSFRRKLANLLNYKPSWMRNKKIKIIRISSVDDIKKIGGDQYSLVVSDSAQAKIISKMASEVVYFVQHDERLYHNNIVDVAFTYNQPFKYVVVANWLGKMLKKEFNRESLLLLNPIDRSVFYHRDIKRKDEDIRILLLHHDFVWKGSKEGVQIIKELKKKYPQIKLIMFGVRSKIDTFGCDEYYYGPTGDKLAEIYSKSDIYLCPSWDEGFGLTSLEAMSCGCAVVTYNNGGSRDFAFDNKTALVAERKNIVELKSKLEKLVTDNKLRKEISLNGINFCKSLPTIKEQAKKLEDFIFS